MKPSDPLLLANGNLGCGMYPAGKVAISQYLAIPRFPQSDHTVGKPIADAGSLCSEAYRVPYGKVYILNWLWQIEICKLDFVWRYLYISEVKEFEFHQPVFKKVI